MLWTRHTSRKSLAAVVTASALVAGVLPAASASAAPAKPIKKTAKGGHDIGDCVTLGNTRMSQLDDRQAEKAVGCLVNRARQANGVPPLVQASFGVFVGRSSLAHAQNGVATRSWVDWQHSHMEPGAPGDLNTQVNNRILSTGYCAHGSWMTREVTYTQGQAARPVDAVNWWLNDPPHREVLLDPALKLEGAAGVHGLADPAQQQDQDAGTFVVDFASCNGGYLSV